MTTFQDFKLNMLSGGDTLESLIAANRITGLDIRFSKIVPVSEGSDETCAQDCAVSDSPDFVTVYLMTAVGEALPLHDADLSSDGDAQVAALTAAVMSLLRASVTQEAAA